MLIPHKTDRRGNKITHVAECVAQIAPQRIISITVATVSQNP